MLQSVNVTLKTFIGLMTARTVYQQTESLINRKDGLTNMDMLQLPHDFLALCHFYKLSQGNPSDHLGTVDWCRTVANRKKYEREVG
jgi:hypothetical protein